MAHSSTMTVRLDEATLARLNKLSKATERTKAYLANKAIEEYLANQEWQVQAIQEAVAEADKAGAQFHEHSEIVKKVHQMIRRRRPRSPK